MLSYQHAFHAGNHADVLKHLTLVAVLQRLNKKAKPYFFLDTHAGEGLYQLDSEQAKLNTEANDGVLSLLNVALSNLAKSAAEEHGCPSVLENYVSIVSKYAKNNEYPGSPMVTSALLRKGDKAFAAELHPHAFGRLEQHCFRSGIKVQHRDGFDMLKAMLPPKPNRGAVLIDPPYESASEYQQVLDAISMAVKRWPIGIYLIWYPLLSETREDRKTGEVVSNPKAALTGNMLSQLAKQNVKSILNIQFCSEQPSLKTGMYGSGMCILNPPWKLEDDLDEIKRQLENNLRLDSNQLSTVQWLKTE